MKWQLGLRVKDPVNAGSIGIKYINLNKNNFGKMFARDIS